MFTHTSPLLPTPVTDPDFPRSRYHLTPDQVSFFDQNGYLILPQWIPQPLLARLNSASKDWIEQSRALPAIPTDNWDEDFAFRKNGRACELYRVNYLHDKGWRASLELLGAPQMLALAESLCGVNFTPTYESLVLRPWSNTNDIRWQQDALHSRRWRIFNTWVHLDAARKGDGVVFIAPRSQREDRLIERIQRARQWKVSNTIAVELEPGDVLLQDVMLAHRVPKMRPDSPHRTLIYEFRAAEQILAEGPWDRDWIERRMRLTPLAIKRHAQALPGAEPFEWKVNEAFRPRPVDDEQVELKVAHVRHMDGASLAK